MNINLEWTEFWYSGNPKARSEYRRLSNAKAAQLPPKKKIRKRRRVRKRTARRKHRSRIF